MTLKRLSFVVLALVVGVSAIIAGVWYVRYLPYRRLLDTRGDVIVAARNTAAIKTFEISRVPDALPEGAVQVIVSTPNGDTVRVQYYEKRRLVVTDLHGGDLVVVRRDIFDDSGALRIRMYFGPRGDVVLIQYLDESGTLLARVPLLMPFGGRGTIY